MVVFDRKIVFNTFWIISEKFVSVFGLVFVNSLVAKYIGAENFGKLNLSVTIFAIIQIFSFVGSQDLIFRRASKKPQSAWYLIHKTQIIRSIAFFLTALPTLIYLYFYTDLLTFYFGLATAIATYIAVHDVYITYFNARLKSYINTICNVISLIIGLSVRFVIAWLELDILWLTVPIVLLSFIPFLLRWYIFLFKEEKIIFKDKFAKSYKKYLLFNGIKLVPYTLSVAIFTRISQLFLVMLVSMKALGIYSAMLTIGNSLAIIVSAIVSSLSVEIYSETDNQKVKVIMTKSFVVITALFLLFYIFVYLFGDWIINFLYGEEYKQAADYLLIYAFGILFATYSGLSEKYIIRLKGYDYLWKKMLVLLLISIPIAYGLIYYYGLLGAVISVVVIEIITSTVLNYFFSEQAVLKLHKFAIVNCLNPAVWKQ